ncbi:MAG: exodeoxyribonuclease I [Flavobacteriia bacterium]
MSDLHPDFTFLFMDYETFNSTPRGGRASQFAGIRTDSELNILPHRAVNLFCEQSPDNIPSPIAALITGITPQKIKRIKAGLEHPPKGHIEAHIEVLNEYEFTKRILGEMKVPHTCTLGYNSIRFDDEFTRNLAFRNLFDPYEREYANYNSRFDVYHLVLATYVLRPHLLTFPNAKPKETGEIDLHPRTGQPMPSFKLEDLSKANGATHANAHDAFSDVEATIFIMKKIKDGDPAFFEFVFSLRDKSVFVSYLNKIIPSVGQAKKPIFHISSNYGKENDVLGVVYPIMEHPTQANTKIYYDLRKEAKPLLELDAKAIHERLFSKADELKNKGLQRLGLTTIKANQCEVIADLNENGSLLDTFSIDKKTLRDNLDLIRNNEAAIKEKLNAVYRNEAESVEQDSDLTIYSGGFFSKQEKDEMTRFHGFVDHGNLSEYDCSITLSRLPEMIFKIKARNFPEILSFEEKSRWTSYIKQRLTDASLGAQITFTTYSSEMAGQRNKDLAPIQHMVLDELDEYIAGLKNDYAIETDN